jgi:hypothetical protein
MPITTGDILLKYSVATAAAGNASSGSAAGSLGGYISTTVVPDNVMNALFPDITPSENEADNVDYKCVFVHNQHATLSALNVKVYFPTMVSGGSDVAMALDNHLPSALASSAAQADLIADKNTAPTAVGVFSAPTDDTNALVIGTLQPGQCRAVWIKRLASGAAAVVNDGVTLRIECDETP